MKRPRGCRGRFSVLVVGVGGVPAPSGSVSGGLDGEGVEVVGQDRPAGPGPRAVVASEPAAAQAVAAFEVADAALGARAVAREAFLGPARGRVLAARDEHLGGWKVPVGGVEWKAAIERDFARRDREPVQLGDGLRQQLALIWRADLAGGRQDQPARAAARVGRQLGELEDVAELVALAELALADRPRVRVGERDEPVGDLLAREALADLPADFWDEAEMVAPTPKRAVKQAGSPAAKSRARS